MTRRLGLTSCLEVGLNASDLLDQAQRIQRVFFFHVGRSISLFKIPTAETSRDIILRFEGVKGCIAVSFNLSTRGSWVIAVATAGLVCPRAPCETPISNRLYSIPFSFLGMIQVPSCEQSWLLHQHLLLAPRALSTFQRLYIFPTQLTGRSEKYSFQGPPFSRLL